MEVKKWFWAKFMMDKSKKNSEGGLIVSEINKNLYPFDKK